MSAEETVSVAELINYGRGTLRPALDRALLQIEAVHQVPNGRKVALRVAKSKRGYTMTYNPRKSLLINTEPYGEATRTESIIQCFGYHLDLELAPGPGYSSTDSNGPFSALVGRALDSAPAAEIRRRAACWDGRAGQSDNWKSHRDGWLYLLEPYQLFSRAYAQWVISRAGLDDELLQRLAKPRLGLDDEQRWSEQEFQPLASALDRAFDELGWRDGRATALTPKPRRRPSSLASRLPAPGRAERGHGQSFSPTLG